MPEGDQWPFTFRHVSMICCTHAFNFYNNKAKNESKIMWSHSHFLYNDQATKNSCLFNKKPEDNENWHVITDYMISYNSTVPSAWTCTGNLTGNGSLVICHLLTFSWHWNLVYKQLLFSIPIIIIIIIAMLPSVLSPLSCKGALNSCLLELLSEFH